MNVVQPPVQVITLRIVKPNLDVFYPAVTGLANPAAQHMINTVIINTVNGLIMEQGYYTSPQTQVTGWYELKTNERGILSLNIGNYAYPPKAAHGMTYIRSHTFDIHTGKEYTLSEQFKPGSDYVKVLSDMIQKQIVERDIPLLGEFKGIRPEQDYYIADKALIIYFQLYEITPYYVGFPMFPISVFSIQDMLRQNSPLDRMATND